MIQHIYTSLFFLVTSLCMVAQTPSNVADYVSPLMGTQSTYQLSNGNTYPAIGRPWGMNYWTPQTGKMGDGWIYTYTADKIRGFRQTHQPSPWMNDYGQFAIMPTTGKKVFKEDERASWYSHKAEVSKPYYYSAYLADHDIMTELTATERAAHFRLTYPANDSAHIIIDAFDKGSYIKVIKEQKRIVGYTTRNSGGVPSNFKNYFVIHLDKNIDAESIWVDSLFKSDVSETNGNHVGAVLSFKTKKGERIHLKVASSFISIGQAEVNLRELEGKTFDQTVAESKKVWNETLGRVVVEGGTSEQLKTFYSCLYRTVCFPQKHYEINMAGNIMHYSPYNGEVLPGYMYAGTGFWDTFRALYPLLNFLYPAINKEMQEGLINCYKEGGFLPEWSSPGFRNVMVGNNSASVVSDAYIKGLRGYDIQILYDALVHGANNEGPLDAVGRKGVQYYNDLGYVPYDVKINENAARTLEYAYDDFTIWSLAKKLKKPESEIALFEKRMLNYRKLFDPETKLMRGKNKDGTFQSKFNPFKWGDAFTEGNSWHYSWSVFHDVQGLIDLMGGKNVFTSMLDSVFSLPPVFDDTYYGFPIHEIREMQIMNMGQYAHGNQPIQHMTYLYNYGGQPWKTQYWVREVLNRMYTPGPDGYCGDEDNGQTSAWYVFSALGFYPVCPGTDQYVIGAPLFKKVNIHLENGKMLVISAPSNSAKNKYVRQMLRNNQVYSKNYITHFDLMKGGSLSFEMSAKPNLLRGTQKSSLPYSYTIHK